jgi:hypothetical protein
MLGVAFSPTLVRKYQVVAIILVFDVVQLILPSSFIRSQKKNTSISSFGTSFL